MQATMVIRGTIAAALMLLFTGAVNNDAPPDWAFIVMKKGPDLPSDKPVGVAGSKLRVSPKRFAADMSVADWFPGDHPKPPAVVVHGREGTKLMACAACHTLTGAGSPDNAALAGLPADYIVQQFEEFRSGRRGCAVPPSGCGDTMAQEAASIGAGELRAAADYFARTPYRARFKVVEAARVPMVEIVWYAYMAARNAPLEPIGDRILELPDDLHDYLAANWRAPITVYVPPGSLGRGKALTEKGARCASCHGAKLQGAGLVPPLAGRSPSYLYRQLYDVQFGFRKGPAVSPMLPQVAHLSAKDRLALAAYLASLKN